MEIKSKELYKARPQIMGVAALLIILTHIATIYEPHLIAAFHRFTQIGVDIFLFLAGIGCYQSISHRTIPDFYWQRIKRVIPSYLLVFVGYGVFQYFYAGVSVLDYWQKYSMLLFPINTITWHWFIFGILALYLLTPLFYKMVGHFSFWAAFVGIILVSSQLWFYSWRIPINIYIFNELFITRIPVYMLGMYYGKKLVKKDSIVVDSLYLKLIGIILLIFCNNYFNEINSISILHYLSIPASVYVTVFLASIFSKIKIAPLEWYGKSSLESYLLNEKIMEVLATYTSMGLLGINFYTIILTILCAAVLRTFISSIAHRQLQL